MGTETLQKSETKWTKRIKGVSFCVRDGEVIGHERRYGLGLREGVAYLCGCRGERYLKDDMNMVTDFVEGWHGPFLIQPCKKADCKRPNLLEAKARFAEHQAEEDLAERQAEAELAAFKAKAHARG